LKDYKTVINGKQWKNRYKAQHYIKEGDTEYLIVKNEEIVALIKK